MFTSPAEEFTVAVPPCNAERSASWLPTMVTLPAWPNVSPVAVWPAVIEPERLPMDATVALPTSALASMLELPPAVAAKPLAVLSPDPLRFPPAEMVTVPVAVMLAPQDRRPQRFYSLAKQPATLNQRAASEKTALLSVLPSDFRSLLLPSTQHKFPYFQTHPERKCHDKVRGYYTRFGTARRFFNPGSCSTTL